MKQWVARHRAALLSATVVSAYLIFLQWMFGWNTILSQWKDVGAWAIVFAICLMMGSYLLRAWRIHDYFPAETGGHFGRLFRLTQIHNLLNIMLPFRSGEIGFPMLMRAEFGVSIARSTSALLVMRLLDLHALLAAGGVGVVLAFAHGPLGWIGWFIFLFLPAAGFAFRRRAIELARACTPQPARHLVSELEAGLPENAGRFLRAWWMTLLNWFAKLAMLAAILVMLGVTPPSAAVGGALGGELSSVLPFHAPAGVGTYPAAITAGALAFGSPATSTALETLGRAGINLHLLVIVSSLAGTLFSLAGARGRNHTGDPDRRPS